MAEQAESKPETNTLHPLRAVTEKILLRDPLDEIRRAFRLFDDDNTGRISIRNLKRVAKELGENLDDEELCVLLPDGWRRLSDILTLVHALLSSISCDAIAAHPVIAFNPQTHTDKP